MSDKEDVRDVINYRNGLSAFTSPKGIRVLVLRLEADPSHTPEWIANARRVFASQKQWRREMEGDWSTPEGDSFFPIFSDVGRERYVHMARELISGPVYRAYDTGRRRPVCIWFQYSQKQDRLWILREFMPHDLQTHEFRDAVRYLSGEPVDINLLPDRVRAWIDGRDGYANKPSGAHCPPPWFPLGTHFIDIGGSESSQVSASATDPTLSTFQQIMAAKDIYLYVVPKSKDVDGRNRVIERMLMVAPDNWPRTFIDPQCEELIEAWSGALTYPKRTIATPVPDKPYDDGHYINLNDAIGYGIWAVVPHDDSPKAKRSPLFLGWRDREAIYDSSDKEEIGWMETRRGLR